MFVCELNLKANFVMEGLFCAACAIVKHSKTSKTYLDEIQVQDHADGRSDFILETVHLKTHAFEHDLCARRERDLLQECRHLRTVECRRREEHVELYWEKPERRDIILAGLVVQDEMTTRYDRNLNTHKLHYPSDRPLDIDPVIAVYGNQAR